MQQRICTRSPAIAFALALTSLALTTPPAHSQAGFDPLDDICQQAAPTAPPGTPEWAERDLQNIRCAEARSQHIPLSWSAGLSTDDLPSPARDPYRAPARHHGIRFRYTAAETVNRSDEELAAEIYRPCTAEACTRTPAELTAAAGPYPTVLIVHGGGSQKELHRWAAQALAESGYMTITFDVASGDHGADAQDMVDWIFSDDFPHAEDLDRNRVGIAGHSQGGSTASLLGQIDDRLKAIVAWDNLTALNPELWRDDIGVEPPAEPRITTPALGIGADYYFTPHPNPLEPEPPLYYGEGGRGRGFTPHVKDLGYQEVKAAGVDTMMIVLRAGTHLDFTPLQAGAGSRYGEPYSLYLTKAWFDRYLKGLTEPSTAEQAYRRLVATRFDESADVHSIGAGYLDPVQGNQPYRIAGLSICNRMSFYFKSRVSITAPGSQLPVQSEDWKARCLQASDAEVTEKSSEAAAAGALNLIALIAGLALTGLRRRQTLPRRA